MNRELVGALTELEKERGISRDILVDAIEQAIVSAYKRNYGATADVRVELEERGDIRVYARKQVAERVEDPNAQIALEEARRYRPTATLGETVEVEVTPAEFGRIAAQTAKQVVVQRIREAERALIYEEFAGREGDIVTGVIQRRENRNVIVDLGRTEGLLLPSEQIPGEPYPQGARLKVYVMEVRRTAKGPQILLSRSHPGLLKRLFELEVPEIHDGLVEIKAVAREAGNRSKIAVASRDPHVDPVGACVGPRGMRVQTIVRELRGERIDVIPWDRDPERFIANALSPARVQRVYTARSVKMARAVVPDDQLSLAIGREGQNARLAAKLVGWKIDIKSESQAREMGAAVYHFPEEALLAAARREELLRQLGLADRREAPPAAEEGRAAAPPAPAEAPAEEPLPAPPAAPGPEEAEREAPGEVAAREAAALQGTGPAVEPGAAPLGADLGEEREPEGVGRAVLDEGAEEPLPVPGRGKPLHAAPAFRQEAPAGPSPAARGLEPEEEAGDEDEELEAAPRRAPRRKRLPEGAPVRPARKSRVAEKEELERLLEEVEEEPLPSLFEAEERPVEKPEETVFVVGEDTATSTLAARLQAAKREREAGKKRPEKPKRVFKSLSQLQPEDFDA